MSYACLIPEECNSKDALFTVIDYNLKGQQQLKYRQFILAQYFVEIASWKSVMVTD